jgi:creatinine amidohydrolase
MKIRYEEMTPREFLEAVEKMPVFIVPTGLLEWHGDHLPLGQDALKAHGICLRVAEKLGGGIVLPPQLLGETGFFNIRRNLNVQRRFDSNALLGAL